MLLRFINSLDKRSPENSAFFLFANIQGDHNGSQIHSWSKHQNHWLYSRGFTLTSKAAHKPPQVLLIVLVSKFILTNLLFYSHPSNAECWCPHLPCESTINHPNLQVPLKKNPQRAHYIGIGHPTVIIIT